MRQVQPRVPPSRTVLSNPKLAREQLYDIPGTVESAHDHYRVWAGDVQLYRYADDRLGLVPVRDGVGVRITAPPTQLTVSTGWGRRLEAGRRLGADLFR